MSEEILKAKNGKLWMILIGAAIGIAVMLIALLFFAALIYFLNLDRAYSVPFSTVSLALGSFAAAYYVSKRAGHKGYLIGAFVGIISFAAVTVISLITSKGGLTVNTLFHFVIIVLSSSIGGILGVNKWKDKKYI